MVRPKKSLGQHFLRDQNIARKIVESLVLRDDSTLVLEIGPGTGVLTRLLAEKKNIDLRLAEIDRESIEFLSREFPHLEEKIIRGDFLELDWKTLPPGPVHVIGNFPYNISSQIFFSVLDHRDRVRQVVCMIKKEVADRISSRHGNKTYGILSILLQAFYSVENLFRVSPGVFNPPPKVMSAVIRMTRNDRASLDCDEELFRKIVKQAFQKRRKTLRNALKHLNLPGSLQAHPWMDKRPEQLSVEDYIFLTRLIQADEGVR